MSKITQAFYEYEYLTLRTTLMYFMHEPVLSYFIQYEYLS